MIDDRAQASAGNAEAVDAAEAAADARAKAESAADAETPRDPSLFAQFEALYDAGSGLTAALRRLVAALGGLFRAEASVLWAGIPLFFIGTIALVAFSVSLWACVVALIAWALMVGTHSAGIALGILVAGHALLVVGLWFAIKRGVRQASFPLARAELHAMTAQMSEDLDRFVHPRTRADPRPSEDREETAP